MLLESIIYLVIGTYAFAFTPNIKIARILTLLIFFIVIYSYYFTFIAMFAMRDGVSPLKAYIDKDTGIVAFTKDYINGEL